LIVSCFDDDDACVTVLITSSTKKKNTPQHSHERRRGSESVDGRLARRACTCHTHHHTSINAYPCSIAYDDAISGPKTGAVA
jgi:hypothetical protein